jgi:hypothetical protein
VALSGPTPPPHIRQIAGQCHARRGNSIFDLVLNEFFEERDDLQLLALDELLHSLQRLVRPGTRKIKQSIVAVPSVRYG